MKMGKVRLTHNLLHSLLHLPDDVKIMAIQQDYTDCRNGIFTVTLAGNPLPEICSSIIAPIRIRYANIVRTDEFGTSVEDVKVSFDEAKL